MSVNGTVSYQANPANTAYILAMVGIIFQALGLLFIAVMMPYGFGMMSGYNMMGRYTPTMFGYAWGAGWNIMTLTWLIIGIGVVAASVYALTLIGSRNPNAIHAGSILLLVLAIIAFPTMWGLLIGSALMFAAAIIGLSQHP